VILLLAVLAGCRPDDQRTDSVGFDAVRRARDEWPAGVAAQVDSGNAAYRAGALDMAAGHFRQAVDLGPSIAAAWFGLYMTEHARGNLAVADSALERARDLAPGASLIRPPVHADTAR
jgi:Flp pilus assembly protein TadD